ncbi:MAG: transcriptional regulator [Desulfosudaceae bacterium]
MKNLPHDFIDYVAKVAGLSATWGKSLSKPLPQYLSRQYALREVIINGQKFLGILLTDNSEFRPATFEKHLRQLMAVANGVNDYCLVAQSLPGYVRRRLVERRIPFVVPGQQMHWPALGLAARARKTFKNPVPVEALSPAAQMVVLYALNGHITGPVTPKTLAKNLGYAHMTMSRALDEIEANELGRVTRQGRERLLDFPVERRDLWQSALPYMRSPVGKSMRIKQNDLPAKNRIKAGQTALADWSLLVAPAEPVYAMDRRAWKDIDRTIEKIPVPDDGTCRVQIWRYAPALLTKGEIVDPFSLYLSLGEEADERVASAAEDMMEQVL